MRSVALRPTAPTALLTCALLALAGPPASADTADDYVALVAGSAEEKGAAWSRIAADFDVSQIPMLLDVLHLSRSRQLRRMGVELMQEETGQILGFELEAWYQWLWEREDRVDHPQLATVKSRLWRLVDPKFEAYFAADRPTTIRLDEVRWGGVRQDGIPPLRDPVMIAADEADYLADGDVVFGVEIAGLPRAYPKRILAWHEMVTETVRDTPIAGVYCTLCGTMIVYETRVGGTNHEFGTSGFLFRSNKLMFDRATQSLWNTLWGDPVIGPLVGQVELPRRSIVTTTWAAWRQRHPDTVVLSLDTGHERDYSEGAAYRDYFATDELMFGVQHEDRRLANKAEIFGLVDEPSGATVALAADFLRDRPVHRLSLGETRLTVLTDASGANRAYVSGDVEIARWDLRDLATDTDGNLWRVTEQGLVEAEGDRTLPRHPAQRAFWFGWRAAFPDTALVAD